MKFNALPVQSKTYLKLGDGKSVTGVFKGDPETFHQVYENGKYRTCSATEGSFRFNVNFIVRENDQLVAKIFQGNWHDYEALRSLNEEFDLENTFIKITQTGERQTKRISFMPITKQKPDVHALSKVPLNALKKADNSNSNEFDGDAFSNFNEPPPDINDDIIPF